MRRAKIVCTIGPATSNEKTLKLLIEAGMDIARLNFSHGDYASHGAAIEKIRKISSKQHRHIAILQDLQGIKIRIGALEGNTLHLTKGQEIVLRKGVGRGNMKEIFISYPSLVEDTQVKDIILLDDGLIQLQVTKKERDFLASRVIEGGFLKERAGVNLPDIKTNAISFTVKDKADLEFGIKKGVDYVALSYVRNVQDILHLKEWLARKGRPLPVIAKIEKGEAIRRIDGIIDAADGIMVARGDLGVEMPLEEIPVLQKMLIKKANEKGKLVITATQMLESMTNHVRPTRAETTDVANAVIDGTDALMLSEETSIGKYPVEALQFMNRIIDYTEHSDVSISALRAKVSSSIVSSGESSDAIVYAASEAAERVHAQSIAVFTKTGFTARLISKCRPLSQIIAFSPDERVVKQMSLYWGVSSYLARSFRNTDELIHEVESMLTKLKYAKTGDRVIIVASLPPSILGKTNFMKIHTIKKQ